MRRCFQRISDNYSDFTGEKRKKLERYRSDKVKIKIIHKKKGGLTNNVIETKRS